MLFIFPIFIFIILFVESLHRPSFKNALKWLKNKPSSFILNIFMLWLIFSITMAIFNTENISLAIVSFLVLLFSLINKYKIRFRGDPLFPWDLALKKECSGMKSYFINMETIINGLFILVFSILVLILFPRTHLTFTIRILTLSISILFILLISFRDFLLSYPLFSKFKGSNYPEQQSEFYDKNGFVLAFILNIKNLFNPIIKEYSSEKIQNILKNSIDKKNKSFTNSISEKQPNIIVIMNESFWDPSSIDKLHFFNELTPTINSLKKSSGFGALISPEFGGGTSNIEFEFLTGHSMYFLPTGSMAYQSYLNKPIEALPHHLKRNGYKTIGLHSYERWFWQRESAYKYMGFDDFISCESFTNPEIKGCFISDMEFSKKVINVYENTEEPLFLYGITMQNHGPYQHSRYTKMDIDLESPLDNSALDELKTYAQGVHDGDKALKHLIDYFDNIDDPTIIVFFGDHLPMLGKNFSTFVQSGYINEERPVDWSMEEKLKMACTPLIVWSNYKNSNVDLGNITPSFLGPKILDYAGLEKPLYFDFLSSFAKTSTMLSSRVPNVFESTLEKETFDELVSEYKILQYDQLFGENYMYANALKHLETI
ncbi:LTA synthase family protein [Clostridium sediminicola]|uniref:LTA synthase family protein n=1 Tax=Clostridium sediminicola TaxID=3114879 RepID=UPI0031F24138